MHEKARELLSLFRLDADDESAITRMCLFIEDMTRAAMVIRHG